MKVHEFIDKKDGSVEQLAHKFLQLHLYLLVLFYAVVEKCMVGCFTKNTDVYLTAYGVMFNTICNLAEFPWSLSFMGCHSYVSVAT